LKRLVFLYLSLLLLLILVPGCITSPAPNPIPQVGTLPVIIEFSNNPSTINAGGTSTLLWNVTGATSVSIDQGIGQVAVAGTRVVSPTTSTIYTISATNSTGTVTRSAVTTVNSASPPPPASTSFAVTGIIANTEPSNSTGCFTLYANITANGPGTATYIWEATDGGGYSYTWNITFPTAGTQRITLPVEMSALPSGLYRVHVLTPNDVLSNSTYYTTCAP
jgi:hypothetical protein